MGKKKEGAEKEKKKRENEGNQQEKKERTQIRQMTQELKNPGHYD